ncbi:hypothetical protein C8R43DRAFT_1023740 [Mycena crocata]|nr:hypothetical protein C8R43DRAFT_1023740 [Mycena crocata]
MDLGTCPICSLKVKSRTINSHIDAGCPQSSSDHKQLSPSASTSNSTTPATSKGKATTSGKKSSSQDSTGTSPTLASIFRPKDTPEPLPPSPEFILATKRPAVHSNDGPPTKRCKTNLQEAAPLAERLRPSTFSEFVGHESVVEMIASGCSGSLILWGPSGCGKTTLARLIASRTDAVFKELSATTAGIGDVKLVVEAAKSTLSLKGRKTILFLDEIHRFNKGQQDIFLPCIERGFIQLIGATTENPSFKLIGALLSRCRVVSLERLQDTEIRDIVTKALNRLSSASDVSANYPSTGPASQPHTLLLPLSPARLVVTDKVIATIVSMSAGDARIAISLLELAVKAPQDFDERKILTLLRRSVATAYDTKEDHYNMISALHKSVRGSQPNAAMYWLARMLTGGEDPAFICRRMVVCASEDIGLADNHALPLAIATLQACQNIGMPECRINLAHLVAYLSEAPKSTRAYEAYKRAEAAVSKDPTLPVPLEMRNAPTALMKEVGYGKSYKYNPEYAHPVHNTYLPSQLEGVSFLKTAGDISDKVWDEEALTAWENQDNGGERWEGRAEPEETMIEPK